MKKYIFEYNGEKFGIEVLNSRTIDDSCEFTPENDPLEWILDVGQDQMSHKAFYISQELKNYNITTCFLANCSSKLSKENIEKYSLTVIPTDKNPAKNWLNFLKAIKKYAPLHIEIFPELKPWDLYFYVTIAKMYHIPLISRCRGADILLWEKHHFLRKWAEKYTLRNSACILVRELYMPLNMLKFNIAPLKHTYIFHNHTPIPEDYEKTYGNRILFLNSLKDFRHPLLMIEIAKKLIARKIDFKFIVVGLINGAMKSYHTSQTETEFLRAIEDNDLQEYFETYQFNNETDKYFREASIYFLPADIVFCNHSLIESMSYKCVPVINATDGSDLIVQHGESGYIIEENDVNKYASVIEDLLNNPAHMEQIGRAAREKVSREFNTQTQTKILHDLYLKQIWSNRRKKQSCHS